MENVSSCIHDLCMTILTLWFEDPVHDILKLLLTWTLAHY